MVQREGRLLLVTCTSEEQVDEHVLWMDLAYDQVIQLPLAWPVWRYDYDRSLYDDTVFQIVQSQSRKPVREPSKLASISDHCHHK